MKYLILGIYGMAGHTIALYLQEQGHDITGFAREDRGMFDVIIGDASDPDAIATALNIDDFDIVINAIGLLNETANKNPDQAIMVNSYLPHHLAVLTKDTGTRVFHLSTDCVFAGNTGPYYEDTFPDGASIYDRTKALGELNDRKNLTFRNSIIGPDTKSNGIGLFNWFMQQEGPINGYKGAIWTGLTTLELAKAIEHLSNENVSGLVNMVPESSISKYDLLQLFNTYCPKSTKVINAENSFNLNKALTRKNFESSFMPADYETQIQELANWIVKHRELYPHYEMRS